ncbi:Bug family tripartite tricarboxylate transporter substrate binding protein [Sabulicella glaciei]|uniref:Tripartite tricarboxylate transporter substrate binding protein n=1 Tax=Sabulicella glaciei TaxID=2984948 RepID=A0ABT3NQF5_9PROT|nr:tripartite tricarboxylate transporter substrate binding protein [Roseococcus sp. MDT2-1-1]MCW8084390.1 tripartite tricarboxylate transporter substrate binding protein [Roseococcus sp. MDT2-1-1]
MITRRLLGASALAVPAIASAQSRALTLVVPYAAGGGTDIAAREFAGLFSQELGGQSVIVENRAGGAGHVGALAVHRARPDGQTLLFAVSTNVVINPHLQRGDRVDLANSLEPVVQTSAYQYVLVVHPSNPARTLQEYVEWVKRQPRGSVTFSSSGVGGNNHLAGVLFAEAAGIEMEHVPYRGTAPALMDVVARNITLNVSSPPPAISLVREGRLRALAVTGNARMPALPEVPTLREVIPDLVIEGWHGIFAPGGTPAPVLDRLEQAARRAIANPSYVQRLANEGLEPPPERPRAAFATAVKEESAYWARKVPELGISLD